MQALKGILLIVLVYGWLPLLIITVKRIIAKQRHGKLLGLLSAVWFALYLLVSLISRK